MIHTFAQSSPSNGASRAEDFQPQTRNPQTTGGNLQPSSSLQSTGDQNVLQNEDAHIVVPSGVSDPPRPTGSPLNGGGINWFFVVTASVLLVGLLEFIFRYRERLTMKTSRATESIEFVTPEASLVEQPADAKKSDKKTKRIKRR